MLGCSSAGSARGASFGASLSMCKYVAAAQHAPAVSAEAAERKRGAAAQVAWHVEPAAHAK